MTSRKTFGTLHLGPLLLLAALGVSPAQANPNAILADYVAKAGAPGSPERGQQFFNQKRAGNLFESCADCHTANPAARGRDQSTEKPMAALAPAANPKRFTSASRVEHMFSLNCKDVVGRVCTAQEKADVLSWLITVKP